MRTEQTKSEKLQERNDDLEIKIHEADNETKELRTENEALKEENEALLKDNEHLDDMKAKMLSMHQEQGRSAKASKGTKQFKKKK